MGEDYGRGEGNNWANAGHGGATKNGVPSAHKRCESG